MTDKRINHLKDKPPKILIPVLIAGAHLGVAYLGSLNSNDTLSLILENLSVDKIKFFSHFFIIGIFLYSLVLCMYFFGGRFSSPLKIVYGITALSLAISILISTNREAIPSNEINEMSIWALFYVLLAKDQPLFIFFGLGLVIIIGGIYYLINSFLTVEYTGGSGIQIRLPGQTVYYLPIFPQISWQDTKIKVEQGEKFDIELYGYVSPGTGNFKQLKEFNKKFIAKQLKYKKGKIRKEEPAEELPIWPYSLPYGYETDFYGSDKPAIIRDHAVWKTLDYYKKDLFLTVKGQTHNKVFGFIQAEGGDEPEDAKCKPAYDWENEKHRELLYQFSYKTYPVTLEAKQTGTLWVVINDDDDARWDNSGLFFLKLTKKRQFFKRS